VDIFRNGLAAALRHLSRNCLYMFWSEFLTCPSGLCTALLAILLIHNQYTLEHFPYRGEFRAGLDSLPFHHYINWIRP
jgi:hypothetical protein